MFKKKKRVGKAAVYKEVTDWEAVFGTIFGGFIFLALLSTCAG
ncbi:MAG: hypothetical protein AAFN91_00900 [Pseudomonadota bacterium]